MAKAASGMKARPRDEDDEDEAPAPKTKKKPTVVEDDEDEELAPKRKARPVAEDDDEDEAPAPKKKRSVTMDDDDDEDEAPAKGKGSDDVIDLSGADENASYTAEVVPRGKYLCQVVETEYTEFKTGSKGMKVRLEVISGEYAKSKKRKRGKTFFTNVVVSAAAADILKTSLKALGVEKKIYNSTAFSPKVLQRIADGGDLIGNEVVAEVRIRSYEGEKQNEVRRMLPPSAVEDAAEGNGGFLDD
jgi:Protein of unknown function (DUF669)